MTPSPVKSVVVRLGSYRFHFEEDKAPRVVEIAEPRLPSLVIGGLSFAWASFKNHPRARLIGFTGLCASAGVNHVIDLVTNQDKEVFSVR